MISIITENSHWIFSGIGVLIISTIASIFYWFFKKKNNSKDNVPLVNVTNNISIATNDDGSAIMPQENSRVNDESLKKLTRILFIDDKHKEFKIVSILKTSGWVNTKSVKDITILDDPKIIEADIIFVDINGVGCNLFEDQGLGLASALKNKYSAKKVFLYSAESKGDRFHKALREVDGCLYKDAEPYQFINLIEEHSSNRK